ncbi:MAG: CHAT domain-containing protein [Spirulina sp. SIO3F2]|nr:CHAT domain-containing protein [Spirulina sp. SIO3F2]
MLKSLRSLALSLAFLLCSSSFTPLNSQTPDDPLKTYYQSVVDGFERTLAATQQGGDAYTAVTVWLSYSQAQAYFGEFEQAKTAAETALRLVRTLEPEQRLIENSILWQLVTVYNHLDDPFGREFLEQEIQQPLDRYSYRLVVQQLVSAYTSINSDSFFGRAVNLAQEAVALARSDGEPHEVVEAMAQLGGLMMVQQRQEAIAVLQDARRLAQSLAEPHRTTTERNVTIQLAQALHLEGESQQGITLLADLVARTPSQTPEDWQNLWVTKMIQAGLYRDLENYAQAIQIHQEREAIARQLVAHTGRFQLAWTLQDLAELAFWQADTSGAFDYQSQAHDQFELEQERLGQIQTLTGSMAGALSQSLQRLGFLALQLDQLQTAEQYLRDALDLDTILRGEVLQNTNLLNYDADHLTIGLYTSASDVHRLLQRIHLRQGQWEAALIASEQGRARGFLSLIRNRFATEPQHFELEPPTLAEIKAIAQRENTTIVQYSLLYEHPYYWRYGFGRHQRSQANQLMIWVIKPTGQITHRLLPLDETDLKQLVRTMRRRVVTGRQGNRAAQPLQDLHALLIEPIAKELPTDPNAKVTFIPDDDLFFVPFAALQDANGVELIERHTILTAPSIQVLGESRRNKGQLKPRDRALIVGNPTMPELPNEPGANRSTLAPLPGAEAEAKAIASLLGTEPLIGSAATETRAVEQMQTAETIHLATHGLLETGSYANSLAFAPSREDDGFLTVSEIAPLKLNADLAVLSACDTGRGTIYNSEGVIGLSRAFIGAGAASVVVSLWAIPDQPTATLMEAFYRRLDAGDDSAVALRQAMLATRAEFPAPSNWAAFTIMGAVD